MAIYRLACLEVDAARAALPVASDPVDAWLALRAAEARARACFAALLDMGVWS